MHTALFKLFLGIWILADTVDFAIINFKFKFKLPFCKAITSVYLFPCSFNLVDFGVQPKIADSFLVCLIIELFGKDQSWLFRFECIVL